MNLVSRCLLTLVVAGVAAAAAHAQRSDLLPPDRRQSTVDIATRLAAAPAAAPVPTDFVNPFAPDQPEPEPAPTAGPAATPVPRVSTTAEILRNLAPELNPTGTIGVNGQTWLLFGGTRVRPGQELPVVFEGERYTLRITDIQPSYFTIELDGEAFTRPIRNEN